MYLISFDSPNIIGNAIAINPYVEPFFAHFNNIHLSYRFSLGTAWLRKPYHPENNALNLFYSTHINFTAIAAVAMHYNITSLLSFTLSGNYNHISNGGIQRPNKGINFPTLSLGADYSFSSTEYRYRDKVDAALYTKTWYYHTSLFVTEKTKNNTNTTKYPVYGIYSDVSHLVGRISAAGIGIEGENNHSVRENIEDAGLSLDHKRLSVLVGHYLLIGRFSFSQHIGIYLYSPYRAMDPVYQRYALYFYLKI